MSAVRVLCVRGVMDAMLSDGVAEEEQHSAAHGSTPNPNFHTSGSTGPTYNGPVDVVRQLYKEGGLKSIFRGTGATLARDGPGSAAYFCAYEASKRLLTPAGQDPQQLNFVNVLTAGGLAGMAMWALAIPPDVIKSRYQGAPHGTYSGFLDCARKTVAKDGMKALFKGFGPAMARAFPANAATFLGVEVSLQAMNKMF